jgi:uncharacterized membrane protein YbhN (UPF0104 family)
LILALLAYGIRAFGFCERWHFLLRRQIPVLARATGYRSAVLGELGNMFLPARAGDAIRVGVVAAPRPEISKRSVLGTLLAERTLDIGCHMVILAIAMSGLFAPALGPLGHLPVMAGVLGLACAGVAGVYLGMTVLGPRLPGARHLAFLAPIAVPVATLKQDGARVAVGLSAVMWLGEVAGWWAASHVVGLNLAPLQAAGVFSIAIFALALPAGPGAVGALEAGVVLALHAIGANAGPALSFVLLLRLLVLAPALLIAAALVIDTRCDWRSHRRSGLALHAKPPLGER